MTTEQDVGRGLRQPALVNEAPSGLRPSGFDPARGLVSYGPAHPDYPDAPSDWDGGPYLCRDGRFYHMRGFGWGHGLGCWNATADWDRIAYRSRDSDGPRMAETNEDSARGEAGPARAAEGGIAQVDQAEQP